MNTLHTRRSELCLSVSTWGERGSTPVLLLHGIGGLGADWRPVAEQLSRGRTVFAPDARGHGASDWSADEAYHTDAHFTDVANLLDEFGIERCVVVGYSMGGGVAILTAAAMPARISGLVVIDSYPAPEMTPGSQRIAERVSLYADAPPLHDGRPRFDPAISRHMAADLAAGRPRMDLWPFWEMLECPILLVRGERSNVLPSSLANEMLARQPRASLLVMAAAGHRIIFNRPKELAAAIEVFLASLPGDRADR